MITSWVWRFRLPLGVIALVPEKVGSKVSLLRPCTHAAWIRPGTASLLGRGETHFPADWSSACLPLLSRNCPLRDFCCLTARGSSFNPHHGFITTLSGDPGRIIYWRYISICNEAVGGKYKPTNKKQTHTTSLSHFLPLLAGLAMPCTQKVLSI